MKERQQVPQRLLWEPQPHVQHPEGACNCWGAGYTDYLLEQEGPAVSVSPGPKSAWFTELQTEQLLSLGRQEEE